jgi:hypothetical protein
MTADLAATCDCAKVRYLTRKHARSDARTFRHRRGKLRAYRCDGGFWHLTSQSTAKTTANRDYWQPAKAAQQ